MLGSPNPGGIATLPQELVDKITFEAIDGDIGSETCKTLKCLRQITRTFNRIASPLLFRYVRADIGWDNDKRAWVAPKLAALSVTDHRFAVRMLEFRGHTLGPNPSTGRRTYTFKPDLAKTLAQFPGLRVVQVDNWNCRRRPKRAGPGFLRGIGKAVLASAPPALEALSFKYADIFDFGARDVLFAVARLVGSMRFLHLNLPDEPYRGRILQALPYASKLEGLQIIDQEVPEGEYISRILHPSAPLRRLYLSHMCASGSFLCGIQAFRDTLEEVHLAYITLREDSWAEVVEELLHCPVLVKVGDTLLSGRLDRAREILLRSDTALLPPQLRKNREWLHRHYSEAMPHFDLERPNPALRDREFRL
ncbi:hypothetical protein BJY01DRAFT_254265 [Aspergillus pseudoustus]|uniref:F-box domain-containing protein n=1 Tax=Aspergillus pseudoustus TaxID=1810923 RepID=A0ABR4IUE1_9EURO